MAPVTPPRSNPKKLFEFFRRPEGVDRRLVGPIRGEVLGADRLAKHARNIARKHRLLPEKKQRGPGPLLLRLDDSRKVLEEIRERLTAAAERGVDISPAGEWLLDNAHIVQEHIREIRTNLPGGYYQELPKLATGTLAEYPRVYDVAIELIAHTEGHLSLENITLFLREYQKVSTLRIGELWAIPTMLRVGLVENIRRMTLRVSARLDEVEVADKWAERLMAANEKSPAALTAELASWRYEARCTEHRTRADVWRKAEGRVETNELTLKDIRTEVGAVDGEIKSFERHVALRQAVSRHVGSLREATVSGRAWMM